MQFSHLHVHTQYSLLDGAASIKKLFEKVNADGMKVIAISDHGNMYGIPEFVSEAKKQNITPIIGCEFYLAPRGRFDKTKINNPDSDNKNFYHQLLLAKNKIGYKNLCKLSSLGFIEGFYYKPRIDKELIRQYHEGIIATSCCLAGEINQTILYNGEKEAEKIFQEWLNIFGDDYYIEIQRHGIKEQNQCNEILLKWAKKYNVKIIATNDVHYVDMRDSEAQDILLCLQTGKDFDDPKRLRFDGNQFYLKTRAEMEELFKDIPEAIDNTNEVAGKIEVMDLTRDVLLPNFSIPQGFIDENEYLRHLTYEGAKKRYSEITAEICERIDLELYVIKEKKFAGYFLIVQDFVTVARQLEVAVGIGRGSVAGSVVAYCTGITNIDPLAYNLLFERFLNIHRTSLPDIDIDFDDERRNKVIDYVIKKYGKDKVAQIVTFGTMAAKSSIRDVGRVLKLPLSEAIQLSKLVPTRPNITLVEAFKEVKELAELKNNGNPLTIKTLLFAEVLDGTVRHTGTHAAGVIISPDNLGEHIPICTAKDANLFVTQYEGKYAEEFGMLKMDFLGLKTLSVIRDSIKLIEENHAVKIDVDKIPLNDKKTFELFQKGDTVGVFQFESDGMQKYLKDLCPNNIEDLIAMNALYRPGPMDFIPLYIKRKHGKEKIEYPHPWLEPILKNTFGIMIYQEQIMKAAQILADYTLGEADVLREIMGKKKKFLLPPEEAKFISRAIKKGIDEKKAKEIFDILAKFAGYGFNRSHAAAYSLLAYQTEYLKANYPGEYMAALLTHNMNKLDELSFLMDECKRMGISVLGPDINESDMKFSINKEKKNTFRIGSGERNRRRCSGSYY
ncbi:MAG: DNA polymerase III subunit alpha [Bacteroidota bacterium]